MEMLLSRRVLTYIRRSLLCGNSRKSKLWQTAYCTSANEDKDFSFSSEVRDASKLPDAPTVLSSRLHEYVPEHSKTAKKQYTSPQDLEQKLTQIWRDFDTLIEKSQQEAELAVVEKYFQTFFDPDNQDENCEGRVIANRLVISQYMNIFGTPDPNHEIVDKIPCGGCGSVLHCNDPALAGYMPSEAYKRASRAELKQLKCSRCSLMEMYNVMLEVKASDKEFYHIISQIHAEKALILLIVDLTDIENSILKDLFKHIGRKRPLYIIGNKVDLIPNDGPGYLARLMETVKTACLKHGLNPSGNNIRHIALVSGKTGYGIEELVTKLLVEWQNLGNVYMVGNTNCGKSTLFNALLQSDYCKSSIRDVVQHATVSLWPGTTINLLKFPILNPTENKLFRRGKRLKQERIEKNEELKLLRSAERKKNSLKETIRLATLSANVGSTDFFGRDSIRQDRKEEKEDMEYKRSVNEENYDAVGGLKYLQTSGFLEMTSGTEYIKKEREKIEFDDNMFAKPRFLFDTPGVIDNRQLINMLNMEELAQILNSELVVPEVFLLKEEYVMYITGLGRIDYVQGNQPVFVVVFGKLDLPIHVVPASSADEFYRANIGNKILGAPLGDADRLMKIPSLIGREFHIESDLRDKAVADIQLSSLGWVSVMPTRRPLDLSVTLRMYTPGGRGIYFRQPSILPNAHVFHGVRKKNSFAYIRRRPLMQTGEEKRAIEKHWKRKPKKKTG